MNKIICFVMVGTNDLEKSINFYDAIFVHLGIKKITTTEKYVGYGHANEPDEVKFYITKPYNKKPATIGNFVDDLIALIDFFKSSIFAEFWPVIPVTVT